MILGDNSGNDNDHEVEVEVEQALVGADFIEDERNRSPTMCTDKWRNLLKEFKKAKHRDRGRKKKKEKKERRQKKEWEAKKDLGKKQKIKKKKKLSTNKTNLNSTIFFVFNYVFFIIFKLINLIF